MALEQSRCTSSGVCQITIAYDPLNLSEHQIYTSNLGNISSIQNTNPQAETTPPITNRQRWESYTLNAQPRELPITLVTLGNTYLSNITPQLDRLILQTQDTETCNDAPPAVLIIQTEPDAQVNITINSVQFIIGTTTVITATEDEIMRVYTIDGLTVAISQGVTEIIAAGNRTDIALTGFIASHAPQPSVPDDGRVISRIPRTVFPYPMALNALSTTTQLEQIPQGNCIPNPTWIGEHVVLRGENLTRIASLYNLTTQEFQAGNCLENPNQLRPNQILRVPLLASPTPPVTATPPQPFVILTTPGALVNFTVDATSPIEVGSCTYLRWSIGNAEAVYLNDSLVNAIGASEVCPIVTTVYSMRVVHTDGTDITYTQAVLVDQEN